MGNNLSKLSIIPKPVQRQGTFQNPEEIAILIFLQKKRKSTYCMFAILWNTGVPCRQTEWQN